MITAAVDILGGIGADYVASGKCNNGPPAAFLKLHGMKDPFITYDRQVSNRNDNFTVHIAGSHPVCIAERGFNALTLTPGCFSYGSGTWEP